MPKALDLTKEFPRSPYDALAGFFWLPRLIDKARAGFAGTRGDYSEYPCGADKNFIAFYGLDTDALGKLIQSGATDDEIAAWVMEHQKPRTAAEAMEFYQGMAKPPADPGLAAYLAEQAKALDPTRNDIDSFTKLICVEEGHPFPANTR